MSRRRGHDPSASDWSGYGRESRSTSRSPETEASHMPLSARMFPGSDGSGHGGGTGT